MAVRHDVVVIGASLGGVSALRRVFGRLPADLPGSVFVALHRSPYHEDHLAEVLGGDRRTRVHEPVDQELIAPGRIYLAPRDQHLVIQDGRIRLVRSAKEHSTRPAVDPLFRSAAAAFGARVAGLVLTGGGSDGVSGLIAIKAAGGMSIVQDPAEAEAPSMPRHAIAGASVDGIVSLRELPDTIEALMSGRPLTLRPAPASSAP